MVDTKVKTTTRLWSTEVAMARAAYAMDSAQQGIVAVEEYQQPVVYEFSGGHNFRDTGKKPAP